VVPVTDYGHELRFGTFITPEAAHPDSVIAAVLASEGAGLDLATFQDHPYQPGHLDTWTLMSYLAARTTAIGLSANVLNLPLRQPAVIARSVASLDRLSHGRVELGLGAGAFWDAIAAMGGRRLTPGQAVQALEEAMAIIRGIWDVDHRGMLHVDGFHYRVEGAKRGPAPVHPISIWVGAYRPRMLDLVGRLADGWLPTLGYLQPGDLERGNRRIDQAAERADRDPIEVRRLLNIQGRFASSSSGHLDGPPRQWIAELAELALESGVGTFILATDDIVDIERFGQEVAPGVREAVESARSGVVAVRPDQAGGREVAAPLAASIDVGSFTLGVRATPDDGDRRSDRVPWDESTRPVVTATGAESTYTDRGRAIAQHLVDVHDGLRAELAQVEDVVRQVRTGTLDVGTARSSINEMTLRQNNWAMGAYCAAYCRIVTQHHSLEDHGIFPHLSAADPELTPVIDRLREEHDVISHVLDGVDRALVAHVADPADFEAVDRAMDLLSDALLSHLAYEERALLGPLAQHGMYPGQL
jgi:alkanesulfonate monooxygenase SsuD/methylene tetrahydromethanopterin reductase-like flavin-dependent oxidoreductase (luciferase family)